MSYDEEDSGNVLYNPKVKVKDKKRVYAMVYHRLQSIYLCFVSVMLSCLFIAALWLLVGKWITSLRSCM